MHTCRLADFTTYFATCYLPLVHLAWRIIQFACPAAVEKRSPASCGPATPCRGECSSTSTVGSQGPLQYRRMTHPAVHLDGPGGRGAEINGRASWARLGVSVLAIFALFQWSAAALGSDRGQAGVIVCALVVGATLLAERVLFIRTPVAAARAIGLGAPRRIGMAVSGGISVLLLLVVPAFLSVTGSSAALLPNTLSLLPGLVAQGGIAEEALFRGYLFGHLRKGRPFWRAAGLSMWPFTAAHLIMFVTMPWPVARSRRCCWLS